MSDSPEQLDTKPDPPPPIKVDPDIVVIQTRASELAKEQNQVDAEEVRPHRPEREEAP